MEKRQLATREIKYSENGLPTITIVDKTPREGLRSNTEYVEYRNENEPMFKRVTLFTDDTGQVTTYKYDRGGKLLLWTLRMKIDIICV